MGQAVIFIVAVIVCAFLYWRDLTARGADYFLNQPGAGYLILKIIVSIIGGLIAVIIKIFKLLWMVFLNMKFY